MFEIAGPYENTPVFNKLWLESDTRGHRRGECSWRLENTCRYATDWFHATWNRL